MVLFYRFRLGFTSLALLVHNLDDLFYLQHAFLALFNGWQVFSKFHRIPAAKACGRLAWHVFARQKVLQNDQDIAGCFSKKIIVPGLGKVLFDNCAQFDVHRPDIGRNSQVVGL